MLPVTSLLCHNKATEEDMRKKEMTVDDRLQCHPSPVPIEAGRCEGTLSINNRRQDGKTLNVQH